MDDRDDKASVASVPRPLALDGSLWSWDRWVAVREGAPIPNSHQIAHRIVWQDLQPSEDIGPLLLASAVSPPHVCVLDPALMPLVRWCDSWDFVAMPERPGARFWVGGRVVAVAAAIDVDEPIRGATFDLVKARPGRVASRLRGGK